MFSYTSSTTEVFLRLLVAAVLGGLIGLEREFHGRPAGLRTHILVSLGAAIIMGSSQIFEESFMLQGADSVFRIDPGRISAGVVTGIGFLGAGAIVRSHDIVRGLTTAACIWFAAAVGIVVGCGLYLPAVIATGLGLAFLMGLDPIGHRIPKVKYGLITMIFEKGIGDDIENHCLQILREYPVVVQKSSISANAKTGEGKLIVYVRTRGLKDKHEILTRILSLPNLLQVSWQ